MMLSTVFQLGAMTGTVGQALHLAITGAPSEPPAQVAAATDAPTSDADSKANSDERKPADEKAIAKTEETAKGSSTTKDAASIPPSQRPEVPWAVLVCIAAIVLLWSGTYRRIEVVTTFLVVSVTLLTVAATCALPFTTFPIPWQEVMNGLKFQLPAEGIAVAFGVFGITGVGATELFFYPYWCLEKGYARYAGPADSSPEWEARAKGWIRVMHLDAWVSMIVFTISTLAFYFMGAAVLHPQGLHPEGQKMILTLSRMFVDSFGGWTQIVFLIGAAAVLFKTLYLSSAGNARLLADFISLAGVVKYQNPEHRGRMIHWLSISIPVLALVLFLAFKEPKWMVVVGGFGQALMLPIISFATIYFRYRKMDRRMEPRRITDILMWIAAISITLVAGYALKTQVEKLFSPPAEVQDVIKPPDPQAKPPGQ
ncbi:MAG: Nramp family divalent metal transporter [Planctomycetaceae bacterium]|nr:Nramp family divalent metal transporter [Planctomycetaceae bacterium]